MSATAATTSKTKTKTPPIFANGDLVRVAGTDEHVLALFGRELVGAVGTVLCSVRRSHGHNRYMVHFPAHTYVTQVKRLVREIPARDHVLLEYQMEHVEVVQAVEAIELEEVGE